MKYILLTLGCVLALYSCKEEPRSCWQCSYLYEGGKPDKAGDTILCTYSKDEIEIRQGLKFDGAGEGYETFSISNCRQQ